jgi:hypothetical protein
MPQYFEALNLRQGARNAYITALTKLFYVGLAPK